MGKFVQGTTVSRRKYPGSILISESVEVIGMQTPICSHFVRTFQSFNPPKPGEMGYEPVSAINVIDDLFL